MLKNYLKIAFRNLWRQKGYSFINITGLAIGITCSILILLFILDELSYDRFHEKAEQIYRVTCKVENQGKEEHYAVAVPGLAPTLAATYPEVLQSVRISLPQNLTIHVEDQIFTTDRFFHADFTFFRIFDFQLTKGNPATALSGPNKVILAGEQARKIFGDRNPVGETITAVYGANYEEDLEITGVVETIPEASHFRFNMLVSFETLQKLYPVVNDQNWWMRTAYTYVLLPEEHDAAQLENKLPGIVQNHMVEMQERSGNRYSFELQPLTDIHLRSHLLQELEANGDIRLLYIFGSIAVLLLLIGCINFMNLATARATKRSKEIGVRKTLGANRRQLVRQFYMESCITVFLAALAACLMLYAALPVFNHVTGKGIKISAFLDLKIVVIGISVTMVAAILAGSYPAVVLSSFKPVKAFKGMIKQGTADILIRKGLVVFQFAVSVTLLAGLMVIQNQLDYVMTKDLGFEKEQVLVIPVNSSVRNQYNFETVEQQLLGHSGIRQAAHASHIPTRMLSNNTMVIPEGAPDDQPVNITSSIVSASLKETLGLELKEGRNFSVEMAGETTAFVVNEAAVDFFGWDEPIGKSIKSPESGEEIGQVIGVYKNFHAHSLHQNIEPVVFSTTPVNRYSYTILRLESSSVSSAIAYSEKVWSDVVPNAPFEYFFLDEQYQKLYQQEEQAGKLIGIGSILAILIACLGLFGLAAFAAERRTKEIGIRKVMGASVAGIVTLLSKDFLKLVIIGFVIAIPVAWYAMNRWLEDFAYRIEIGPGVFILAGLAAVMIALATVSYQSIKASMMNPVESLRNE